MQENTLRGTREDGVKERRSNRLKDIIEEEYVKERILAVKMKLDDEQTCSQIGAHGEKRCKERMIIFSRSHKTR